jgi:hypothetical protein
MAFWKFKSAVHHWIGKLITLAFLVMLCFAVLYFSGDLKRVWVYLDRLMTTGMW